MTWKATTGRVTLFPTPEGAKQAAGELYKSMFGVAPEATTANSSTNTSTAQGKFGGMGAFCSVQPLRIDVGFAPLATQVTSPNQFPFIEDTTELMTQLLAVVDSISKNAQRIPCTRVAVFVQLSQMVKDSRSGNAIVVDTLPSGFVAPLKDEGDVIFQMNRKYPSESEPSLALNFVTRWSVDQMKVLNIPVSVAGQVPTAPMGGESLVSDFVAVNIVLDNSTIPSERPLSSSEISSSLRELLASMPSKNGATIDFGTS